MQNKCAEIKLRAERRAGEILADMEKNKGGPVRLHDETALSPKLSEIGISKARNESPRPEDSQIA